MRLTNERITELAETKGAKPIAVKNFLHSLGALTRENALLNLEQDAHAYRWSAATIRAIRAGIREVYAPAAKTPKNRSIRVPTIDRVWQRENAMLLGMGLGVEAYNDAMGCGSERDE